MSNTDHWENQIIRDILSFEQEEHKSEIVITDIMREGSRYCLDRLPDSYGVIFYQRYRDKMRIKTIQESVGQFLWRNIQGYQ